MQAARFASRDYSDALRDAPFGLMWFGTDHRLVHATPAVRALLPDLAERLQPGLPLSAVFGTDVPPGRLTITTGARPGERAERRTGLETHRPPEGGILVLVRDESPRIGEAPDPGEVIEGGAVATWECDTATGTLHVNDRWMAMLGRNRADLEPLTIETWRRLLHPDDRAVVSGRVTPPLPGRDAAFDSQFRLQHQDGSWVWVQSRGRVLRWSAEGTPAALVGVHIDITAQKAAEQRLEHILEGAQVGTWQYDEVHGVNHIDARWAEMLGYRPDELEPMDDARFCDLLHPDDRAMLSAERERRQSLGAWKFDNEFRLRHKAGHWVWVLSRGLVTEVNEHRQPLVTSGVHIDISDRKALQVALARERDFLAGLMETSITGIMAMDAQGRVIFANREAEIVMGRPIAQLLGQSCAAGDWEVTMPDGAPIAPGQSPFARALTSGCVQRGLKMQVARPDGSRRTLMVNSAPLSLAGVDAAVVCALADITDSVEAEQALRRAMERAEAGNRAKSEFLANMSHEIRTPLNGVLGMADVLAATLTTDEQRDMLQTIQTSGALLLSILNDVLDLAKIESGRLALDLQPFVPQELALRVEALHGPDARRKGVALVLDTRSGACRARIGDAQRIFQILHNLVGNAIRFTETGEVRLVVVADADGPLVLRVTDTGIGMTEAETAAAFQDFAQADGSITRRFGGTGLGLPIVRNLVALMGGTVDLTSQPGLGTQVVVALPLPDAPPAKPVLPVAPQGLGGLRALVAEDNGTNRMILQSMLTALGVRFTMVDDGDEAVAAWGPHQFDILLLDISMPRCDGISALQAIRARAVDLKAPCPPALAVTANAMAHHLTEYLRAGFAGCVAKPIRMDDLAAAIRSTVLTPHPA